MQLLSNASKLKTLGINGNLITEEMMKYIIPILRNNPIEDLGIGNNNLGDEGMAKLATVLLTGSLKQLGLRCSSVTEEAADDITAVNHTIQT